MKPKVAGRYTWVRRGLAWIVILLGLILLPLPGPGIVVIAVGMAMLGRREPLLRRVALLLRWYVRGMSRSRQPVVARLGAYLRHHHTQARHNLRTILALRASGRPLPPTFRLLIVGSVVWMLISLGFGMHWVLR